MHKFHTYLTLLALTLGSSLPTLAQVPREEPKNPPVAGEAKDKVHPPTKQMNKASSPEKTGVPEHGTTSDKSHPPTKQMDKAASPDKTAR